MKVSVLEPGADPLAAFWERLRRPMQTAGAVIWRGSGDAWDKASDGVSGPPEETQDSAEGTAG